MDPIEIDGIAPRPVVALGPRVLRYLDLAEARVAAQHGPEAARRAREDLAKSLQVSGDAAKLERRLAAQDSLDAALAPTQPPEPTTIPPKTARRREKKRREAQAHHGG